MAAFNTEGKSIGYRQLVHDTCKRIIGSKLPTSSRFISLCADCTVPNNELQWFTSRCDAFFRKTQYVGIDRNPRLIAKNKSIQGPEWRDGKLRDELKRWIHVNTNTVGVVNADFMGTYEKEYDSIEDIFRIIGGKPQSFDRKLVVIINGLCACPRAHYLVSAEEVQAKIVEFAKRHSTGLQFISTSTYRKGIDAYDMVPFVFARTQ